MSHSFLRIIWIVIVANIGAYGAHASPFETFGNFQNAIQCFPRRVEHPPSEESVQEVVRLAVREGLKVKAATPKFAVSNRSSCVNDGGIQVDTSGLKEVLAVDVENKIVTVQPGIKLWDLNQILHRDYGLTLPAVQEYADVTIGGMIGNSTHGSSLEESSSSVHDRVLEVRLVDGLGDVRVIRGADLDFIGGNLGVLGILTSVVLRVEPTFKVRGLSEKADDSNLEEAIIALAESDYSVSVTWFPRQKAYSILRFEKVPIDTPGEAHNGQTEVSWWKRKLFPLIFKMAHFAPGDQMNCFLEHKRLQMKVQGYIHDRFATRAANPVGWSHEMLNFVCRERCPLQDLPTSLEEIAVPLEKLPKLISRIKELLLKAPTCLPLNGIYMRFGRASRGAIAMAQGRDTVYVGVEYVVKQSGNHYEHDFEIIQEIEQIMVREFEGRPHWGKNRDGNFIGLRDHYPRLDDFLEFRDRLDPHYVFENEFFQTMRNGTSTNELRWDCVAKDACYCSEDSHCPRGYVCGPGLISLDARVCHRKPHVPFWRRQRDNER